MHLLYCDETNLEPRSGDFFTYAGVAVESSRALALSKAVDKLRANAGIASDFRLKFNPKPANLTHEQFRAVKQRVIELAAVHGVVLLSSFTLHDIATGADDARRNAINTICFHFDCYLNRVKDAGLVLIDRFDDSQIDAHLVEKFSVGLVGMPYSKKYRLNNIVGVHYSAIGQSHFTSVIDIVIGSFRYAINAFTREEAGKTQAASALLQLLAPLCHRQGAKNKVSELSLSFSPKAVKAKKYHDKYMALHGFLEANGIQPEQKITKLDW